MFRTEEAESATQTRGKRASRRRKMAFTVTGIGVVSLLAGTFAVGSGLYDVSATRPHSPVVERALRYAMKQSVRRHANGVQIPTGVSLTDPALAERAAGHYSVVCASCHAAPGKPQAPWMVLYPPPADLTRADVVEAWNDQ
jgi:hypothetical protein